MPIIAGLALSQGDKKHEKSGQNHVTFFAKVGKIMLLFFAKVGKT